MTAVDTLPAKAPAAAAPIASPKKLAHVVLRTSHYDELLAWYKLVLNATEAFENGSIAFLAYDDEHHRVALIRVPGLQTPPKGISGVHHVAFTYATLGDLLDNYVRLKAQGVVPACCLNHGPTTSMYYEDPDGNQIEFQIDNHESVEEAGRFFFSREFADNPLGVDFDPEDLLRRLRAGEGEASLKARPPGGVRAVSDSPLH